MASKRLQEREIIVNEMLLQLHAGREWADVKQTSDSLWKLTESSFNRYWKSANAKYKEMIKGVRDKAFKEGLKKDPFKTDMVNSLEIRALGFEKREQLYVASELRKVENAILTREQGLAILSQIANGQITTYRQEGDQEVGIHTPSTNMERIMALNLMSKIDGWELPAVTDDAITIEFKDAE